ncbi:DNA processing protein DprA [Labrys miyagiensis]
MSAFRRRPLSERERLDWLRLIRCEGIGPISFKGLVESHGSAAAVLDALPDIARRSGRALRLPSEASLERECAAMNRIGARFLATVEPDYPEALAAIDSAPPVIGFQGSLEVLAKPMIAIVGARNASAIGERLATELAAHLASAGYAVVSGLARGIDRAVHQATSRHGTIAVVAGGLGKIYPPQHEGLVRDIVGTGAVISEAPFDWVATARDFPKRNRIVSGLALGVVVIEAAMKSGSLITARLAVEQGRELMAVPGSPLDPRHDGCNKLIREGATLVRHAGDVLEVIAPLVALERPPAAPARRHQSHFDFGAPGEPRATRLEPPVSGDEDQNRLVALLGPSPVAMDDLVRASGLEPRRVQLILLDLDLAGRIERHGNGMVSLL